ncbi:superoxide dismutase [Pseudonocardiaceae bacterium YIM PH 21723]|nr:superoxide dismutase [Pseudonocardiaceae bacterium YIM PH 21723]
MRPNSAIAGVGGAALSLVLATGLAAPASAACLPKHVHSEGTFQAYAPGATAVTYDQNLVPAGAKAQVNATEHTFFEQKTTVVLTVQGLLPNRHYGAHVHTKSCGAGANDSGPHYQNVADPKQPSTDPAYANSTNEVWLDFMTNENGDAYIESTVGWVPRPDGANAVVLHDHHTSSDPGNAGVAGPRLGCVSTDF